MIIVDASAIIEVVLNNSVGRVLAQRLLAENESLHAPHLIDLEVAQVLRRYARTGDLVPARAVQALDRLMEFPITRHRHDMLLSRIWELRHNLTAYDAAYVALAEALDAPLVTRDAALASAAGHHAQIELI